MSTEATEISKLIKTMWWLVLLRGIFTIILGVLAFIWPVATAGAVFWVFGLYAIADGVINIVQAVTDRKSDPTWGWLLTVGIVGLLAGLTVLVFPFLAGSLTLLVVLWIVALWAVIGGIFGIPAAASVASGGAKVLGIVFAALTIVFGIALIVLLASTPATAVLGLIYVLGVYAVLAGLVLVVVSFQARSTASKVLAQA